MPLSLSGVRIYIDFISRAKANQPDVALHGYLLQFASLSNSSMFAGFLSISQDGLIIFLEGFHRQKASLTTVLKYF